MPRKYTITYREVAAPITDPVTKFGGQPVWVDAPRWPLSRVYGTPMQFICQIALPTDLFGSLEARMAYLFVTDNYEYVIENWDPDCGENALIVQPGGRWEGPSLPLVEGPSLYGRTRANVWARPACEFAVELYPGADPEAGDWDHMDPDDAPAWNAYVAALSEDKIGGTPVPTAHTPQFPDPRTWRLLLQLHAKVNETSDPFYLCLADDGVGYAFLSEDGHLGKFLWSR